MTPDEIEIDGKLIKIPRYGPKLFYLGIMRIGPQGQRYRLLFTKEQVMDAIERARRNPNVKAPALETWGERCKRWLFG